MNKLRMLTFLAGFLVILYTNLEVQGAQAPPTDQPPAPPTDYQSPTDQPGQRPDSQLPTDQPGQRPSQL